MPVLVGRIEQVNINCLIWVGLVSKSDALEFPGRIDPSGPDVGCDWISYFDRTADLSDLNAACLLEVRERLRPVVAGLAAKGEFRMMLVSHSKYNDPLLAAWQAMTSTDAAYASEPVFLDSIASASRALGLSAADAEQVRGWIRAQIGRSTATAGF